MAVLKNVPNFFCVTLVLWIIHAYQGSCMLDSATEEFECYASTDCHGHILLGASNKGDCCGAGNYGLSFSRSGTCEDCFNNEAFTSLGKEFYVGFPNNLEQGPLFSRANLRLKISTDETGPTSIDVITMSGVRKSTIIEDSVEVELSKDFKITSIDERDKGVHIKSNGRGVSVVALSEEDKSADLFLVSPPVYLPDHYVYYAVSVERNVTQDDIYNSAFLVVATEDGTEVVITPTTNVTLSPMSGINGTGLAGQPMSVVLNKMNTLYVTSSENLSGSKVVANKPITFISGHECGNIPTGVSFCDHMFEQIPPTSTWGKEFYTVPLKSRRSFDVIVLVASENDTIITRLCNPPMETANLSISDSGGVISLNISSEQYCRFLSNKPVLVAQFAVASDVDHTSADPFMMIIPPFEQYRNKYFIPTFEPQYNGTLHYFVNVVLITSNKLDLDMMLFDGSNIRANWSEIVCDVHRCAYGVQLDVNVSNTSHVLSHMNPEVLFSATVYAFGLRIGQGYTAGFNQKPVALDRVSFSASVFEANEADMALDVMLVLQRSSSISREVRVRVKTRDLQEADSAEADIDYFPVDTEVIFDLEESSKLISIKLPEDDVFFEANKTFEVYLTATPGVFISPIGFAYATILNDDEPLTVVNISFGVTSMSVLEGTGFVELILTKSDGAVGAVSVNINTVDGTAEAGKDYAPLSTVITFEAEDLMAKTRVKVFDNLILQPTREFSVEIEVTSGLRFPAEVIDSVATIDIQDDDLVVIGLNPVTQEVIEGGVAVINMEILAGSLEKDVVVSLTSADESAEGEQDYTPLMTGVTFSKSKSFNSIVIPIHDDRQLELAESFSISLSHSEGESVLILPAESTIWILDNDDVEIGFVVDTTMDTATTVYEGHALPVTVRVDGDLSVPVKVELSTLSRTAIGGRDFENFQRILSFDQETMEHNLSIATFDNPIYRGSKNFAVQLSLVSGSRIRLAESTMIITILDDDTSLSMMCYHDSKCLSNDSISVPTIDFCCNQLKGEAIQFSAAGGTCQPCIRIDFDQSEYILSERLINHTVPVTVTGGRLPIATLIDVHSDEASSTAGSDDFNLYTPSFQLLKGSAGSTVVLEAVLDDFQDDENAVESFILQLLHNADILPPNVVLGTSVISIMDVVPRISFEQAVYSVYEQDGRVSIGILCVGERIRTVNFRIVTTNSSAIVGVDYSISSTFFSLQPDQERVVLDIDLLPDNIVEKEEFFDLAITDESDRAVVEDRLTQVQIKDNTSVIIGFMDTHYTVREDSGQVNVCIVIANEARVDFDFTVEFSTVDGTAVGGEDYGSVSTILTFSEESVKCIPIPIINDEEIETETETFSITLSLMSVSNQIQLQNSRATVEIIDVVTQNVTVRFERTSYIVSEAEQQLVVLIIEATGDFVGPISLMLNVSPQSDDYILNTSNTIEPTITDFPFEILIQIVDDCQKEENETFIVSLTSLGQMGVTLVDSMASITILDNPVKLNDDVLQFLDLNPAIYLPAQDDSISEVISPPGGLRAFGQTYSNLYVTTNGRITIGEPAIQCCPVRFEDIHVGATAFIAPYWIDNNPSIRGNVSYSVFSQDSELLLTVSNFIAKSQQTSFSGTWMLVAFWRDVPEALLEQVNSYQAILITNGIRSFAVFIYNCDKLDPSSVAGIGYYFNESVQMEHVLASTDKSSQIACENPCTPWNTIIYRLFDSVCDQGQVRLANEVVPGVGRVEICFNNEWGTVCDDNWDVNDAIVVCRQLGLPSSSYSAIERAMFGEGEGSIWLDEVACSGSENELQDCAHNGVGINNCRHREDASVACVFECDDGTIRLNGGNATAGRVEVCYNNVWGTVCDDSWDVNDARVVCNQLNLTSSSPIPVRNAGFGEGDGVIWLDDVSCNGDEESLQSCRNNQVGVHNCDHGEDAGVVCTQGLPNCFTAADCTGDVITEAADQRECCVGTNDGLSYFDGSTCNRCVVYGFENAVYDVNEDDRLDTMFQFPAKGEESDVIPGLVISGIITAEATGTSESTDFERLSLISVRNTANIRLFTSKDNISLEYDDRVRLVFTPDNPDLVTRVEGRGQYMRTTATVKIIDIDILQINFDQSDYSIVEGSATLSSPIMLQFRQNQNPFTIMLSPVTVATAEAAGVGSFINSDNIGAVSRATSTDFSNGTINITIPANRMSFEIQTFFNIIDDDINEFQQTFAIIAEIIDVPENISCFQHTIGERMCQGQLGATAIRITDNDPMVIGFTERRRTVSEGIVPEGFDEFRLTYDVAALRTSEMDYPMRFRLLEGISTATVHTRRELENVNILSNNDAVFGEEREDNDPIEVSVRLLQGSTTLPQELPTYIRADFVPEYEECYTVHIIAEDIPGFKQLFTCNSEANATNYFCEHEICIADDDEPFEVAFVETVYTVDESVGAVNICVNFTKPEIDILDERVQVFVIDNSSSMYIPPGGPLAMPDAPDFLSRYLMLERTDFAQQTGLVNAIDDVFITELMRIVCYNQPIYEDLRLELDEYAGLTLGVTETEVRTEVLPMYDEASILIVDNDRATVGLEQTFFRVGENESYVELCAIVSFPEITCPIEFPFNVSLSTADRTAVQTMDFGAIDVILEFGACLTRKCVNVGIVNDTVDEEDEIFTYHLRRTPNLDSRIDLAPIDGTVEIIDDDVNIIVGYNPISHVTSEGQGMMELTIEIFDPPTGGAPRPFTLVINTQDGTAIAGAPDMDYDAVNGEIVQFAMGDTFQTHTIIINNDDVCENDPNEFFFSNIALDTGVQPISVIQPQATVTIDDAVEPECLPIEVGYEFSVYTTTEGTGVVTLCAVVMNSPSGSPRPFTINATTEDGSAVSGSDYVGVIDVPLMFGAGDSRVCHDVDIINNVDCKTPYEDFFSNLEYDSGLMPIFITRPRIQVIINDTAEPECEPITVGYDPDMYMTTESDGSVTLTVRVFSHPGGAPRPFTLAINTEDGTATVVDNDYVPVSGQIINFNRGDVTQTHTITINDDDLCENDPNENFFSNIVLASGIPDINVTVPRATITIGDTNEIECNPIEVGYEFSVYTTTEGTTLCAVVMNPPGGSPRPFAINATAENGTAVSGSDYVGVIDILLMFGVGDLRVCHDIAIIDDNECEAPYEDFFFNLEYDSGVMPITITRPRTQVIINDTAEPECADIHVGYEFTIFTTPEGDTTVELCAIIYEPTTSPRPFNLSYQTSDGSALAGQDYLASSGRLVFERGDTRQCHMVQILNDDVCERPSAEDFFSFLALVSGTPVIIVRPDRALVLIDDSEDCPDVMCPMLLDPMNGMVLWRDLTEGARATYSCNEGFVLAGDAVRICQSDGMWSGEEPTCFANVLQYLDLGSNAAQLSMEDDSFSSPIMVPGQIPFFNENYSSLFVFENGVIFFGMVNDEFSPYEFSAVSVQYPDTKPFVAPYWIDNDLSLGGNVSYGVFTGDSTLLSEVNNFISISESIEFSGTWMLVAYWIDVPFFGSGDEDIQSNTYQAVVITNGSSTYTVFTYRCDDLDNATLGGRIGYYNDSCNFIEHPLSVARMSSMVACENEEVWSNIVYNLTPDADSLQLLDLGNTPGSMRVFLPGLDDEFSGNISSAPDGFPLTGTRATRFNVHTNGLIFIDGQFGLLRPQAFSNIVSGSFIAPYWLDNDPSMGGTVSYEVHDGDSPLLREVSCSISNREKVRFGGTWMLVVYWSNVPLFATTMTSTYQGILITDGTQSYAVFIYECGGLAVDASARIGYYISALAFTEHRLSGSQPSEIGCEEPVVVYKLTN